MKRLLHISFLYMAAALLSACTDSLTEPQPQPQPSPDARELAGIRAEIAGATVSGFTRAGTVTPLADYVGRSKFVNADKVVFTQIRRTQTPFEAFTYGSSYTDASGTEHEYNGILFNANADGGWVRDTGDGGPERIYWTDATSPHTFVAYSIPQSYGEYWKKYQFTQQETDSETEQPKTVKKTYFVGAIGNPTSTTGDAAIIDYSLDDQVPYTTTENNVTVYKNPKLEHEDVVIAYDETMKAEPGGSVALVKFHHALSSIRVVVNISGFSAGTSATADNATVVSDMRLLHQPTMYVWMQTKAEAQPLRAYEAGSAVANDQDMVGAAWQGYTGTIPAFDQRKDIKLWIPRPKGVGSNQSKTFTFYGITTPQPEDYISTLPQNDVNRLTELQFKVTYPNPMKPSENKTETYKATLDGVYYWAGYNTTINISLNHRNEKMTVGAEYENWQFVATPDVSVLKKNSTFLNDTERSHVTIADDAAATADDATWLYKVSDTDIRDIYGHTGNSTDAYQISTAYQLLSFAYEVKSGRDFTGKFVRLDADLSLQQSSDKTKPELLPDADGNINNSSSDPIEWIGIGDANNAFNGTFLGGHRYIHRLYGSPLFASLGPKAEVKQLNVDAISINNGVATIQTAVLGGGLFAETSEGRISGCRVVGDVTLTGNVNGAAGAFVGINTGVIYCCYHIGATKGTTLTGGLVGRNELDDKKGTISSCYQVGVVVGTESQKGIVGRAELNTFGNIVNTYFNKSLFNYTSISNDVVGISSAEMVKAQFVTDLNDGIIEWLKQSGHEDYDPYKYVHQPANYPTIEAVNDKSEIPGSTTP